MANKRRKNNKKSIFKKFIKIFFYITVILIVVVTGFVIGLIKTFSKQLPEIDYYKYKPSINSKIYDCRGNIIKEFHQDENRTERVPLKNIPQNMQNAIVSIEDARFFSHYGIDPIRLVGVFINLIKYRRIKGGGSTLTMQLARNAFLTLDRTFTRKIKEILLSFKIERKFTKKEILDMYLNEVYYGHRAYGIASAAKIYFDKKVSELNLFECAILAGLVNRPHYLDLYRHKEAAKKRGRLVLHQMVKYGYISQKEADEAAKTKIILRKGKKTKFEGSYFVEYVRKFLNSRYTSKQIYTQGLKIYTTYDPLMQKAAEEAFKNAKIFKDRPEEKFPDLQGALIAIDPINGHIKAMVGGRNFSKSPFNRVTMATRQPGSSFKPFVYLTAILKGLAVNTIMIDQPLEITDKHTKKVWKPRNYGNSYFGPLTVKEGLMRSLNSIAVQLVQKYTPEEVIKTAHKMGIKSKINPFLSIALGAVNVKLIDMARAYCAIANGGVEIKPVAVTKILDSDNHLIYQSKFSAKRVVDRGSIYILTDMMRAVIEHGTGRRARLKRPCAGKTGTTNDYVNAWFCGFTPDLVACLYIGNDHRKSLGRRMSAGRVAAPIWKAFMSEALKNTPPTDFKIPDNIVIKKICRESGLLASEKCTKTFNIAFKKGSEPTEVCNLHNETEDGGKKEEDGTIIYTPKMVIKEVKDVNNKELNSDEIINDDENLDLDNPVSSDDKIKTILRLGRRSRFQNHHDN